MPTARQPSAFATSPRVWAASFLFWTVFGTLSAAQLWVRVSGGIAGYTPLRLFNIVWFYWAWALLTPALLDAAERISGSAGDAAGTAQTGSAARLVASHLAVLGVVLIAQAALYASYGMLVGRDGATVTVAGFPDAVRTALVRHLAGNVLTYASIVGVFEAWRRLRRASEREREAGAAALRASELESLLSRARLDALRTQLHPHFLFNTLNMISGLVARGDPVPANRAIARLGELLRASLDSDAPQQVPLARELELTRTYLEIARLRLGDRLRVSERIDDRALDVLVPVLVLQPLVENAVQHAVSTRNAGGRIEIAGELRGGALIVEVRDDGPGFGASTEGGVGLANVRARLELTYGAEGRLETSNAPHGGAVVRVRIPAPVASGSPVRPVPRSEPAPAAHA